MKLRKFLTRNPFINFLRCLGMPEMKIKRAYWIEDRVWNDLLLHWNALEYCSKCAHAKKRASEKGGLGLRLSSNGGNGNENEFNNSLFPSNKSRCRWL